MSVIEDLKRNRDRFLKTGPGKVFGAIGALFAIPLLVTAYILEKSSKFAAALGSTFLDLINVPDNIKKMIMKPINFLVDKITQFKDLSKEMVLFGPKTAKESITSVENDSGLGKKGEEAFYQEGFKISPTHSYPNKENRTDIPVSDFFKPDTEEDEVGQKQGTFIKPKRTTNVLSGQVVGQEEPERQNQM